MLQDLRESTLMLSYNFSSFPASAARQQLISLNLFLIGDHDDSVNFSQSTGIKGFVLYNPAIIDGVVKISLIRIFSRDFISLYADGINMHDPGAHISCNGNGVYCSCHSNDSNNFRP